MWQPTNWKPLMRTASVRLRLLQPEPHIHLAVHRRRGGEVLLRLLALTRAPVELAEAEVAVGDEGDPRELDDRFFSIGISRYSFGGTVLRYATIASRSCWLMRAYQAKPIGGSSLR